MGTMAKDQQQQQDSKPPLTVQQLAAMGGKARAKRLSKARRKEIAQMGSKARWKDKPLGIG